MRRARVAREKRSRSRLQRSTIAEPSQRIDRERFALLCKTTSRISARVLVHELERCAWISHQEALRLTKQR
jgi:hypothetical protein